MSDKAGKTESVRRKGAAGRGRRIRLAPKDIVQIVREHDIQAVITDLDGTAYGFWHYFVPAMRTVIPQIAGVLGLGKSDFDRISQDIGRVMARYGTHEHPWALEETWMRCEWKGPAEEFRDRIVRPFWSEMDHYRTKYLKLYPFVRETLERLDKPGIPVVGLSDAPAHMALVRVTQTQIDELLYGVYALETVEPDASANLSEADLEFGRDRVRRFANTPHRMQVFQTMPKTHEKPSPLGIRLVMERLGITDPSKVLMVGDSLTKDGGVAQAIGCPYIWAWYGTVLPPEYTEMIDVKFNPNGNSAPITSGHGVSHRPKVYPPMVCQAASYAAVLEHLNLHEAGSSGTILPRSATPAATSSSQH